jgi:hypothetical protein
MFLIALCTLCFPRCVYITAVNHPLFTVSRGCIQIRIEMQHASLSLTFPFARVATSQCISNQDVRPIDHAWKIESIYFLRYGNDTGSGSSLKVYFDLYRPCLDKCPTELNTMSLRECQWASRMLVYTAIIPSITRPMVIL